ncbi:Amino-acid carrier protein AlsT [Enhygromyxa salina]|uniref:Amino-acid carrier protein AlsT n=1 Tax=Enhygromyxa salina TaxID=215803 RepID=A0A2S9XX62_9BACT|nr:alanine/glycine:cation symporter family protein [Enhygromyxa salina]PRP97442.1 Amino-acid carrier protein AlsT [Enhygromyxa salina]
MSARRALTPLLVLIAFVCALASPATARAGEGEGEPGVLEQSVDKAFGVVVKGLTKVLFAPVFADSESVTTLEFIDEVDEIEALVAQIEAKDFAVQNASLTLTVPASELTPETAKALEAELGAAVVPSAPKGTRTFKVVRSEDARETTLEAKTGGVPIIALWLVLGAVFFTVRMGFINLRAFRHAIDVVRGRYDNPDDEGEVSHFQALASALSATVGLGNIAGVALAVAMGGPGAIFWMIIAGFLGMSSKFVECTLAQVYRKTRPDGRVLGGPMSYLDEGLSEKGMKPLGKILAVMFAILCIGGSFGGGNTFQVSQSLGILRTQIPVFDSMPWLYGLVMAVAVGIVILGGIKRIAATAEKIVPLMCGVYVLACLFILVMNIGAIPSACVRIVSEAFTPMAGFGGFVGVLVTGIRRAVFSNEAGVGSASIAHSAAKTEYPVREGIVALLEPFIDTIVVCTMTGLVIVITGAFENPDNYDVIANAEGAALTARAMGGEIVWFPWVLTIAVVLFAYSTMISWSYYGERCFVYLFGDRASTTYKIIYVVFVFLGSIITAGNILNFGDLMILSMGLPNILGLVLLSGAVKKRLDAYMGKLRSGEMKRYEPDGAK